MVGEAHAPDPVANCSIEGAQPFSYDLADVVPIGATTIVLAVIGRYCFAAPAHAELRGATGGAGTADCQLLEFCACRRSGCLRYTETRRSVRTRRQPGARATDARHTARAAKYGVLLDPLRAALGTAIESR